MKSSRSHIRIGTRGSRLALWQANWVKGALLKEHPLLDIDIIIIRTKGDRILDVPLAKVGGKGLFVKEIENALLAGEIDIAVHSMKDMPAQIPEGLGIVAVPVRENPSDILISRNGHRLLELDRGCRIGTSSLRRSAQVLHIRPDAEIVPLRGNLETRLRKLEEEGLDAVVLAAAGVLRLGLDEHVTEFLGLDLMLPAVGQGALCIESRIDDTDVVLMLQAIDDPDTRAAVTVERAFMQRLEGGCQVPIAAHAVVNGDEVKIDGLVASLDGKVMLRDNLSGPKESTGMTGVKLAQRLLDAGAGDILKELREYNE